MEKTLNAIQVFSKIGKILSTIIHVFCIVGIVGCCIGLATYGTFDNALKIAGVNIHGLVKESEELSQGTAYASMTTALIFCIGQVILTRIAGRYFKNELRAGTPFTLDGAKELLHLGICTICIPIGTAVAAGISYVIISNVFEHVAEMSTDNFTSTGLGIGMILVSLICKYGAQLAGNPENNEKQE